MAGRPASQRLLQRQLPLLAQSRAQGCRLQAIGRRCYTSGEKEEKDSFKGQLYQSTHERVQREKEQEARFAQHRDAERASGSSFGLVIPLGKMVASEPLSLRTDMHSTRCRCSGRMVSGQTETQSGFSQLYSTTLVYCSTTT
jgi:hypothetical protein